jgi:hypothetical protein
MSEGTFWFQEDRRRFFIVAPGAELPEGDTVLVSERGERRRVDVSRMTQWEIPIEEARRRFTGTVEAAWERLVSGLAEAARAAPPPGENPLKALGERLARTPPDGAAARAGEKLRAALASPELARAMEEVGEKLQEAAKKLREHTASAGASPGGTPPAPAGPQDAAAAENAGADWSLRWQEGNAWAPTSRHGECLIALAADGRARLTSTRAGNVRAWEGRVDVAIVSELRALLRAAGPPPALPAPLLPGSTLARIVVTGDAPGLDAQLELHTTRRAPPWAAVIDLLWSIQLAMSGGAIRIGGGHRDVAVDGLRTV